MAYQRAKDMELDAGAVIRDEIAALTKRTQDLEHEIQDFQQKAAALRMMKGIYDDRGLASASQCEIDAMLENARSRASLKTLLEEKLKVMQDLHTQLNGPHGARVAAELTKRHRP